MRLRRAGSTALLLLAACTGGVEDRDADPGRVTLHRLNRAELDRTVRDLLATDLAPGTAFPADDFGGGFDNVADVLALSPLHLELAEQTAVDLVEQAVLPAPVAGQRWAFEAEGGEVTATTGGEDAAGWNLWANGDVSAAVTLPVAGTYRFTVGAFGQQAGPDPCELQLVVDGTPRSTVDVPGTVTQAYSVEVALTAGAHVVTARFTNDYYEPPDLDRNLVVDYLEVVGPIGLTGERPPGWDLVFSCDPAPLSEPECAAQIASTFGLRAWRRPLTSTEVLGLVATWETARDAGESFERSVGWMVQQLLVSPNFWFRVELDPDPTSTEPHPLTSYELASRLSYFLWSSMPDDALFAAAADETLLDPAVRATTVARMLADPKADALVDGLGAQWLYASAVDDAFPDVRVFPGFNDTLRASMKEEMRRAVADVLLADRPMTELLTSTEAWVDAPLAAHYGLPEPDPGEWERVSLEGTGRQGLLTRAGWLTALSYPTRTSPTRRGAWVLGNVLCEAPAPPPPDIPALAEDEEGEPPTSVRDRLEAHRDDPVCSSCHTLMDPIGLSLEQFDGVGAFRTTDAGQTIDPSGALPGDVTFAGAAELAALLASDSRYDRCVVYKTTTRALGRLLTVEDLPYLEAIEASYVDGDRRFGALAAAIADSDVFTMRRGGR